MFDLLFANFAMHTALNNAEMEIITSYVQQKILKKNAVLLNAGEVCRNIYFVNKGCLRIFNRDKDGGEHNILFCPENWWAVDMASFSAQAPAFYTISALEDTEVFFWSHTDLEELHVAVPKLERFFRILSQNGFSLYHRRINGNLAKTAEERYAQFQRQYPGLEQRIAQKQIASYLGITPVFLSMIRGRK